MKSLLFIQILSFVMLYDTSAKIINIENMQVFKNISNSNMKPMETCRENMSLFPETENSTNLVCDCTFEQYLYYAENNACYHAYTQGPCPPAHYLVLVPGEKLAKCQKNPCKEDGLVPYNDLCANLGQQTKACFRRGYLIVSAVDFQLGCVFSRILNIIKAPPKTCPPGTRRITLGKCKHVW